MTSLTLTTVLFLWTSFETYAFVVQQPHPVYQPYQTHRHAKLSLLHMVSIGLGPDEKELEDAPKVAGIDYIVPDHEQHRLDRRSKIDIQCDEWFTQLLGNVQSTGACTGHVSDSISKQLLTVPPLVNDIEKPSTDLEWTPYLTTRLPWSIIYPSYGLEQYGLPIPRRNAESWRNFDVTGMITQSIDGNIPSGRDNEKILFSSDTTNQFDKLQKELQNVGGWLSNDECQGRLIYINNVFYPELSKQTPTIRNIDSIDGLDNDVIQFISRLTDGWTDTLACPVPMQQNSDPLTLYSKLSLPNHNVGEPYTQFAINTQQGTACFTALNTIKCPNIAYVHETTTNSSNNDDNSRKLPILIVHAVTFDGGVLSIDDNTNIGIAMHPRTVIIAEPHTDISIVQQSVTLLLHNSSSSLSSSSRPVFNNGYTQILLKDHANVTHTMIEESGGVAVSGVEDTNNDAIRTEESIRPALLNTVLDTLDVHCAGTDASYIGTQISASGNARTRLSSYISLLKPTAQCTFRGLTLTNGVCRTDVRTCIHHIADGCKSEQLQKQMIGGRGTAAFRGRIRVEQSAQQTDSHQLSRSVLLSDKCTAVAIPSLEIIADDVKCTHGATVSDLSDEEVFYLRSRGLDMNAARNLLMYAFCNDMVDDIPSSIWFNNDDNQKNGLQQRIYQKLKGMTPRGERAIKGEYQSV
jgi:hypothetical protein